VRDQPDRTARQTPSAPDTHRDPVVRGANAIDRYSLALQLIQVFPIILTGVALIFPLGWLRILIAVLGLGTWTAWAIVRERNAEYASRNTGTRDADVPPRAVIPQQIAVDKAPPPPTARATATATATTPAESVHGLRIDLWLHWNTSPVPHETAGRRPRHRRDLPPPRIHRAVPSTPHHHSHTDEPEPEDRPGTPPASASRPGAGLRRAL